MNSWTIYSHIHTETGRRYIGLTKKTMLQRWNQHVYTAKKETRGWGHFPNAIRKYGSGAFSHEVLEVVTTSLEDAGEREKYWIEFYDTRNPERGFNIARGGWDVPESPRRNPWEDSDFRSRVTASVTEAWQDPDYRARMSAISAEINARPEVKQKIARSLSERVWSEETRQKVSANRTGKRASQATRDRISASASQSMVDPAKRQRISESLKVTLARPEARAKLRASNRSSDPVVRAKISASLMARKLSSAPIA